MACCVHFNQTWPGKKPTKNFYRKKNRIGKILLLWTTIKTSAINRGTQQDIPERKLWAHVYGVPWYESVLRLL